MKNNALKAAAAIAITIGLVAVAAPAQAASLADDPKADKACWSAYKSDEVLCFDTFEEMLAGVEKKTGSPIIFEGADKGRAADGEASLLAGTYALVTLYADQNFAGGSYTMTDSNSATCSAYSYTINSMPSGWNDRVSSFQSWATCKTRLSENTNQGGIQYGPIGSTTYVGSVMNDRASSVWITG